MTVAGYSGGAAAGRVEGGLGVCSEVMWVGVEGFVAGVGVVGYGAVMG